MKSFYLFLKTILCAAVTLISSLQGYSAVKTSIGSGNWNTPSVWSPSGAPASSDNIIITSGHTITINSNQSVKEVTVNAGGTLTWSSSGILTISGKTTVNGTVDMNGGNITLAASGLQFTLGANSLFTWNPGTNTLAGATLFTNGAESFDPTSTLIIKKWYNYAIPLANSIAGNFGNLELNSLGGNSINEWNQNNQFETHKIVGTLTIDQGWITLDKSGSILNTTIGGIVLKNVNASFYAHNGTHPGSFTVTTSFVSNTGGNFFGINDGNGNVLMHITGNFTNLGNVKMINNSGVSGVANGNAIFIVDSTYSQTTGDTRVIYNVSTVNSGLFTATFGNLNLTGGIFMGQSGCRTSGGVCSLTVLQNLTISFSAATDKFRGTSISSISGNINNVQLNVTIGGDLSISGNGSAEMTTTASSGTETVLVKGNVSIQGCTSSFNYGAPTSAHNHTLTVNGNTTINGGSTFLSRNCGVGVINFIGNFTCSSGTITVKGADSLTTLNMTGNFVQTGGSFYLHNGSTASSVPVTLNLSGDFTQSGGTFNFDNNTTNTSATHYLNILGANMNLSGTGVITHSGAGTCTVFGVINYNRAGTISYKRTSSTHMLSQVKQNVKAGCTLKIANGNMQAASYPSAMTDFIKVETRGILNAGDNQVFSNGSFSNSGIQIDSGGVIITQKSHGFYNGTPTACINSNYSMNYFLDQNSIVEYNGTSDQELTGTGQGVATGTQHQYGILRINLVNATGEVAIAKDITVRNGLQLTNGEIDLDGHTLTLNNGQPTAITRVNGYINCELNTYNAAGKVSWKSVAVGNYIFPFGTEDLSYIPVSFTVVGGTGTIDMSTYSTPTSDNQPFPSSGTTPVNFSTNPNFPTYNVIDRWWAINATGIKASVQLSYRAIENTLVPTIQTCTLQVMQWNGSGWYIGSNISMGVKSGIGTASIQNTRMFSVWTIGHQSVNGGACRSTPAPLFEARLVSDAVSLEWTTNSEINTEYFSLERSSDGTQFEEIKRVKASGNSSTMLKYSEIDEHPIIGTSYYRLKQTDTEGLFNYSEIRIVKYDGYKADDLSIESFGPNPFSENFWVSYKTGKDGLVHFNLYSSTGQVVNSSQSQETAGEHRFDFNDGGSLQPGVYFLKILINDKMVTQKLIKK